MGEWLHRRFYRTRRFDAIERCIALLEIAQDTYELLQAFNRSELIEVSFENHSDQQQEFDFWFLRTYLLTYREREEMHLISGIAKKFWKGLNADITPAFRNLIDQVKAVYDPHLEPVVSGGMIVDWVDIRTGKRPWFS